MSLRVSVVSLTLFLLSSTVSMSQPGEPTLDEPRPIDAVDSVFIEELTWMEVRDAMKAGKTTAIVATGGVEQNGPYLVTGKHNVVLQAMTESIARELDNALVAPIIKLVPEGDHDPPSGHMRYPGTISLRPETFKAVLTDVCQSLKAHGFEHVVLIGDSGGNQQGMKEVAETLTAAWKGAARAHYIPEFYDYPGLTTWLEEEKGIEQVSEGIHDDFGITSLMMTVDPQSVRLAQRQAKGLDSINGVKISPSEKAIALGRAAVRWRTDTTVAAIRKAIAAAGTTEQ